MCGIFGCIAGGNGLPEGAERLTGKGVDLLRHRGPDERGIEISGPVCLGHARLSIIDLESGRQPMRDHTGAGLIAYNGEVYNFPELRRELEDLGRVFDTRSDTEVVLNAYLEWGPECVPRLRGMFAFAAADFGKQTALLARDRLGIKPLFHTTDNGFLFFSSELEPLYRTVGPFPMDISALDDYLYWQYVPAPRTIYRGVEALPPAHLREIDLRTGEATQRRWWKLEFSEDRSLSIDDWQHRLDGLLRDAVRMRLVSDVPFGAFLSGGIDSSLVVGYMAEIMEQPVSTFSIGFKEADFSELEYANRAAEINRTAHHTEIVEPDSLGLLPMLARHYGQPFADSSAVPTYCVSRMARKHVKMVLSGDGGDENFAGYNSYQSVLDYMKPMGDVEDASWKYRLLRLGFHFYWKFKCLAGLASPLDKAYKLHCSTAQHFGPDRRRKLFREEYRGVVRDTVPERRGLMDIGRDQPLVSRLQHVDLMTYLPFDILTKVDAVSMANSLEVRVPMLDHVLVEAAAEMPAEFKLKEEQIDGKTRYDKKHILKRLAKTRYPEEFLERPKMGFGMPLRPWFAADLKETVRQKLSTSEYLPAVLDREEVMKIHQAHSESSDYAYWLWNLLFLDEWMRGHPEALP